MHIYIYISYMLMYMNRLHQYTVIHDLLTILICLCLCTYIYIHKVPHFSSVARKMPAHEIGSGGMGLAWRRWLTGHLARRLAR